MDKKKWTFMIFMAGDNNLSSAGDKDLSEMRAVGSTADVNIVTEFDNEGDRGTNRYLVQRTGANEQKVSLGETDSGDPKALMDFVGWAAQKYPAERYALVLWNHGGGWEPSEMDRIARSVGSRDYNVREASERSATPMGKLFFRSSLEKIFNRRTPKERAICSDDGSGHSLDTVELGKVLAQVRKMLGQPLDILGMDACLMSNLEVAYQAQRYAKYIVASEESEPNDGWPYDQVLKKLVEVPTLATAELAVHIVQAYAKSYKERNYKGAVTQAAVDLSKVKLLTHPLDQLADYLIKAMPKASREIWNAQKNSARFWHNTLWDISQFCEELGKETASKDVRKAAQEVRLALKTGAGNFVLAESHAGPGVERSGGVSIYLLPPLNDVSEYYKDLKFAKAHRWLSMLQAYHGA
jgi:hypothetical protein